ncbi:MAG: glycerophosphodiester phosphodiesterase family protein [Pseudomonadota bacterium]
MRSFRSEFSALARIAARLAARLVVGGGALLALNAGCDRLPIAEETPVIDAEPEEIVAPAFEWATLSGAAPLIIAHRGASGYRPEHTLAAYELAIDQGADSIEPDLVITKDGVLVARHERALSATTNVADIAGFANRKRANPDEDGAAAEDWWVEDFTLEELKTLKARQSRAARSQEFDDQFDVPTLGEILVLASVKAQETGRAISVYPELKHPRYFASIDLDFEGPFLAALETYTDGRLFVQSFDAETLKGLREKTPAALVQLLDADTLETDAAALAAIAEYADGIGPAKSLLIDANGASTGLIGAAHGAGLFVHAWTFRDDAPYLGTADEELAAFMQLGVDGVFVDFPDTATAARDALAGANP